TGTLTQTGGSNIATTLALGSSLGGKGTFWLSGGEVSVRLEDIGSAGQGTVNQIGGIQTIGAHAIGPAGLYVGVQATGVGVFNLGGGTLSASQVLVGYDGTGSMNHNGGYGTVGGEVFLGYDASGRGTYNLSNGATLTIGASLTIGNLG